MAIDPNTVCWCNEMGRDACPVHGESQPDDDHENCGADYFDEERGVEVWSCEQDEGEDCPVWIATYGPPAQKK